MKAHEFNRGIEGQEGVDADGMTELVRHQMSEQMVLGGITQAVLYLRDGKSFHEACGAYLEEMFRSVGGDPEAIKRARSSEVE